MVLPRSLTPILFVASTLLLLSGCGQLQESELVASTEKQSVCEHQWLLKSLSVDGREHRSRMLWNKFWRDRPYLTCDKLGYARGSTGTNPYMGRFALTDNGALSWLKPPEVSRMSDLEDTNELEQDFLRALPRTSRLTVKGETLILEGNSGSTRLEFRRTENISE